MVLLPKLIAQVESAGNQWAMRFEPGVKAKPMAESIIGIIKRANRCNRSTAEVIFSTSWGAYQIMGYNLYTLELLIPVGAYMAYPAVQEQTFKRFCIRYDIWTDGPVPLTDDVWMLKFGRVYNGPGNPDVYVARMRAEAEVLARQGG